MQNSWNSHIATENGECYNHFEKQFGKGILIKLSVYLLQNPATLCLNIYQKEMKVFH